jgi:hypothetical protein
VPHRRLRLVAHDAILAPKHNLMMLSDSFLRHFADCHDDPCGTCTNIRVCFLGSLDDLRESARRTLRLKGGVWRP